MRLTVLVVSLVLVLGALAQAQTFTDVYSFTGGTDGAWPYTGRLAMNRATGTLYGTDYYYGSSYYGAVWAVTTAGVETTLYDFTGGTDGGYPYAGVVRDSAGNLYGDTYYGGSSSYYGVVYKLGTAGNETVLHSFTGGTDGGYPYQGLARDKKGNLYGTTTYGGANSYGVIFKIDSAGNFSVLHNFNYSSTDACYPYYGSVRLDGKGNLYGVTDSCGADSYGTLWEYSAKGTFSLLYSFTGGADGGYPYGTPARDGKGNTYGTTSYGGANSYYGTVWQVSKTGAETTLHSFSYSDTDACYVYGGLALDKNGNLYGLSDSCGANYDGALFEVSSSGTLTLLHSFDYSDGGYCFNNEVLLGPKGVLYGPCSSGGAYYDGVVWSYAP